MAVVKPNKGEGGKNIMFIKSISDAPQKLKKVFRGSNRSVVIQEMINVYKLKMDGKTYAFDIRAYGYLGELIGFHARRPPMPMHSGSMERWAISNVSRGGMYLPVLVGDGFNIVRWGIKPCRIYLFKNIYVDKYSFMINTDLADRLQLATREIITAISQSLYKFWGDKTAA